MNATCALHPDRLATASCAECNRPICPECAQSVVAGSGRFTKCLRISEVLQAVRVPSGLKLVDDKIGGSMRPRTLRLIYA